MLDLAIANHIKFFQACIFRYYPQAIGRVLCIKRSKAILFVWHCMQVGKSSYCKDKQIYCYLLLCTWFEHQNAVKINVYGQFFFICCGLTGWSSFVVLVRKNQVDCPVSDCISFLHTILLQGFGHVCWFHRKTIKLKIAVMSYCLALFQEKISQWQPYIVVTWYAKSLYSLAILSDDEDNLQGSEAIHIITIQWNDRSHCINWYERSSHWFFFT